MSRPAPVPVVVALGSNLGDRRYELERAIREMGGLVRVVRRSGIWETAPVDAPEGSGYFLNMVVVGWTAHEARTLLAGLHRIEAERGRARRMRNEPRRIDLDLILYGAHTMRGSGIEVPHPRYLERDFVMEPLLSLRLPWVDPRTSVSLRSGGAAG